MDKVKVILGHVKKYHFWLLCGLAMLLSLFGWMKGRSTLSAQYDANKSTITGTFSKLDGIKNSPDPPPNDQWKEEISKLSAAERKIVESAWEKVYNEQKATLKWPDFLGPEFIKWIDSHPPTDPIPAQFCRIYQNYIPKVFPTLLEIVDAAPATNEKRPDGDPGAVDSTRIYKVVWESSSQSDIKKRLEMPEEPSSLEVRVAQEDLWVYGALLNIIRATNEGAQYTSRVKKITRLLIGRDAVEEYSKGMKGGHIVRLGTGAEGSAEAPAEPPPQPAEPAEPGATTKPAPDEGRYVDHKEGTRMTPDDARGRQFKCMPIYMKLEIDQRDITRLLTECANSRLPVEVRQLRVNPGNAAKSRSAASPSSPGSDKPAADSPAESMDVTIEVNGIIYIYNPPDPAKLGAPGDAAAPPRVASRVGVGFGYMR